MLRTPVASNEASVVLPAGRSDGLTAKDDRGYGWSRTDSWDEYLLLGWVENMVERQYAAQPQPIAAAETAGAEDDKRGRKDSAYEYKRVPNPIAEATRAREPRRVWAGSSPTGRALSGTCALVAEWVRRRRKGLRAT